MLDDFCAFVKTPSLEGMFQGKSSLAVFVFDQYANERHPTIKRVHDLQPEPIQSRLTGMRRVWDRFEKHLALCICFALVLVCLKTFLYFVLALHRIVPRKRLGSFICVC